MFLCYYFTIRWHVTLLLTTPPCGPGVPWLPPIPSGPYGWKVKKVSCKCYSDREFFVRRKIFPVSPQRRRVTLELRHDDWDTTILEL